MYTTEFGAHRARRPRSAFAILGEWTERTRQRRQLSNLDAGFLKDVGISESDRQREINKPFWRG